MSVKQTIKAIKALGPTSSLEHWKENTDTGEGKEYFGEFCTPEQIPALQAIVKELDAYRAMVNHENFWEVGVWSYHPMHFNKTLTISQFADGGKWTWFDNDGKHLAEAPMFDTVLEAFQALLTSPPSTESQSPQ